MSKVLETLKKEQNRQRNQLRMIPSENYVSENVMKAVGSEFMNKYSEGQVGKRYYRGNKYLDELEAYVKDLALSVFGLDPEVWGVNVQAVTGSVANLAVYSGLLELGEKIMGMSLYDGGHLSHGWKLEDKNKPISMTSKFFESAFYGVSDPKAGFDYDEVEKRVVEEKPKILISGGTAYPLSINHERLKAAADKVGALYMADIAHEAGLVAAGVHASPFEYADIVTMTTRKTLRGPIGAMIFAKKDLMEKIDFAVFPGLQGGPQNHSIAGIGIALEEASTPEFKKYAKQVVINASSLAEELMELGFELIGNGTEKHLVLVDLRNKDISGKKAAKTLEMANIIVNKNTIPGETASPWNPSGIRLGTPALTSRGMDENHMKQIAKWIDGVIGHGEDEEACKRIAKEVRDFAGGFGVRS